MLRESGEKQLSLYSGLYEKIPENHLLKYQSGDGSMIDYIFCII